MTNSKPDFDFNKSQLIMCCGSIGSGKTLTCFNIMDQFEKDKLFIYDHPLPEALPKKFINITSLNFDDLSDAVLWIDEVQLAIPKADKKNNDALVMLYSLARQKDLILLMSTSNTRWVNRGVEEYIDTWVIKNMNFDMAKQGSEIKNIVKRYSYNVLINKNGFKLKQNEALIYSHVQLDRPIKQKIQVPPYWSDKLSKPYKYGNNERMRVFKDYEQEMPDE
jgi:hypothetical protein